MSDIKLNGSYGYNSYRVSGTDANILDATGASWTLANIGSSTNPYPFQVMGADPGLRIIGGTINGQVSLSLDWEDAYVNSAAVRIGDAPGAIIEDWTISRPWDGIRVTGNSDGFTITDVLITDARDDAVENDDVIGGTIKDSLFDGVFSGISLGDGDVDGSDNVVTIDGLLQRSESYLYKGEVTHQSPFKMDKESPDITPSLRIFNSVFAVERVDHEGMERLAKAWDKTVDAANNYYLNLSDKPFPSDYPLPEKGFTILQGQAARDFWAKARADWIRQHDGDTGTVPTPTPTPVPTPVPTPTPEPTPEPEPATPGSNALNVRISSSADDVEESRSGAIDFTSSDLELADEGASNPGQTIGLRFNELDIPKGAVITRAYVQFQVDEADSGTASLRIRGHDADDAAAFNTSAFNVSSRAATSASVEWKPGGWTNVGEAGAGQRTADIASIVQEIVGRDGWQADNSLALIITGAGERTAESFEGSRTSAPLLHVEWKLPDGSGGPSTPTVNVINGTASSETLTGTAQADRISGLGGSDQINGKDGKDVLAGGAAADTFVFDTRPTAVNVDHIADFASASDRIYLDNAVFSRLGSGSITSPRALNDAYFESDGRADDSNDFVVYNRGSGVLSYDADGSGSGQGVAFATVGAGLDLTTADFYVV